MKIAAALLSFFVLPFAEASETAPPVLATAVQQLRQAAGRWNVTTTRYAENGAVAAVATGTLNFDWVVPDRVLAGKLRHSRLEPVGRHALLPERAHVHARDGAGRRRRAAHRDERPRRDRDANDRADRMPDGRRMLQRHTRYGVTANRFEAKMEMSYDGGANWKPGYHQLFVRVPMPRTDSGARMQHRTRPQPYVPLT